MLLAVDATSGPRTDCLGMVKYRLPTCTSSQRFSNADSTTGTPFFRCGRFVSAVRQFSCKVLHLPGQSCLAARHLLAADPASVAGGECWPVLASLRLLQLVVDEVDGDGRLPPLPHSEDSQEESRFSFKAIAFSAYLTFYHWKIIVQYNSHILSLWRDMKLCPLGGPRSFQGK